MKQEVVVTIFLAVALVESFINVFFRVVVDEAGVAQHKTVVLKALEPPFLTLDKKLKEWPGLILGKPLNLDAGVGKQFLALKTRRNALMHFRSSWDSIVVPGVRIEGLANTDVFDTLQPSDAAEAVSVAEGLVADLLRLRGVEENLLGRNVMAWLGAI